MVTHRLLIGLGIFSGVVRTMLPHGTPSHGLFPDTDPSAALVGDAYEVSRLSKEKSKELLKVMFADSDRFVDETHAIDGLLVEFEGILGDVEGRARLMTKIQSMRRSLDDLVPIIHGRMAEGIDTLESYSSDAESLFRETSGSAAAAPVTVHHTEALAALKVATDVAEEMNEMIDNKLLTLNQRIDAALDALVHDAEEISAKVNEAKGRLTGEVAVQTSRFSAESQAINTILGQLEGGQLPVDKLSALVTKLGSMSRSLDVLVDIIDNMVNPIVIDLDSYANEAQLLLTAVSGSGVVERIAEHRTTAFMAQSEAGEIILKIRGEVRAHNLRAHAILEGLVQKAKKLSEAAESDKRNILSDSASRDGEKRAIDAMLDEIVGGGHTDETLASLVIRLNEMQLARDQSVANIEAKQATIGEYFRQITSLLKATSGWPKAYADKIAEYRAIAFGISQEASDFMDRIHDEVATQRQRADAVLRIDDTHRDRIRKLIGLGATAV